jgi:glycosyltransferase involved in cell wall biosynthesis
MIFTILIPYWGDVNYMRLAIDSVLKQTNENWRLFILDDCYPGSVIEDYVRELSDRRISYLRNSENLGVNANYRKALEFVETPYFIMFGADDVLRDNYVETILNQIEAHPEVSIFQPGVDVIDEHGNAPKSLVDLVKKLIRPKAGVHSGSKLAARLMVGNFTYFPSLTWKTDDVRTIGFRHNFHVTQDLALICDLLLRECKMLVSSDPVFLYRRHASSVSSLKLLTGDRFSEEIELSNILAKSFRTNGWFLAFFAAMARPTVRLHMFLLLPKVLTNPKIFLKTLKGALL